MEWQAEQDRKCKQCGHNVDETFGPDNSDKWNAELAGYCDGCRAGHRATSILAGRDDLDPTIGARFRFWRDQPSTNGES